MVCDGFSVFVFVDQRSLCFTLTFGRRNTWGRPLLNTQWRYLLPGL